MISRMKKSRGCTPRLFSSTCREGHHGAHTNRGSVSIIKLIFIRFVRHNSTLQRVHSKSSAISHIQAGDTSSRTGVIVTVDRNNAHFCCTVTFFLKEKWNADPPLRIRDTVFHQKLTRSSNGRSVISTAQNNITIYIFRKSWLPLQNTLPHINESITTRSPPYRNYFPGSSSEMDTFLPRLPATFTMRSNDGLYRPLSIREMFDFCVPDSFARSSCVMLRLFLASLIWDATLRRTWPTD